MVTVQVQYLQFLQRGYGYYSCTVFVVNYFLLLLQVCLCPCLAAGSLSVRLVTFGVVAPCAHFFSFLFFSLHVQVTCFLCFFNIDRYIFPSLNGRLCMPPIEQLLLQNINIVAIVAVWTLPLSHVIAYCRNSFYVG